MGNLNMDKGTVKLANTDAGPVPIESNGFILLAVNIDTQDEARRLKKLLREAGHQDVDYFLAAPSIL